MKLIKDEKLFKDEKIHIIYLRALINKYLKNYKECEEDYYKMLKCFNKEEGNKIAKYIFGMILLPLETNRKVTIILIIL